MKLKILPPGLLLIFIVLTIVSHFILPIKKVVLPPYNYLGSILMLPGLIFTVWPDALFKKYGTTIKPYEEPVKLVTEGPFRLSRHPTYVGMVMILFGVAIIMGSLTPFVFPVIFAVIVDLFYIRLEEVNLERIFGEEYYKYRKKVRRWI